MINLLGNFGFKIPQQLINRRICGRSICLSLEIKWFSVKEIWNQID